METGPFTQQKPRKWWIAGLLSILQPGLGQIYNGQVIKGVVLFFLQVIILAITLRFLVRYPSAILFLAFCILLPAVYIYVVLDAINNARRFGHNYHLKSYNRAFVYIGAFIAISFLSSLLVSAIKTYIVQAYRIPTMSMEPTLLIGDHILADKSVSYGNEPGRGDIIIFVYNKDITEKEFVKRVVGVGGDMIEIRNKELYLNDVLVKDSNVIHTDNSVFPKGTEARDNYGPVTVPPNTYFVLGDNRDRSFDSRNHGFVDKSKIKGIARSIYWSWDSKKSSVRWNRIGQKIR